MGRLTQTRRGAICAALLVLFLGMGHGCASMPEPAPMGWAWFQTPAPDDAWSPKIAGWQHREREDDGTPRPAVAADGEPIESFESAPTGEALVPESRSLRSKYFDFRAEQKRELARSVAAWVQSQASEHYVEDGPTDHWATLEETLRRNGDDCDGLELLTFHALRDLGFDDDEVYRAIVYRKSDNQHHMVTLWFENPEDPWVIDPTGAMTLGMPKMSSMPGWVPLKLFTDEREYTVRSEPLRHASERLAHNR
jgi:predicted transglutaminase-like cysteine proteinase